VTPTAIKIGFITSVTGNASSTFNDAEKGALAAFDAINKAGGINGRQIELVSADDQSSPTGDLSAMQSVISQGVFMIENFSPYLFGGYKVATSAGIPVIGGGFDGPEWALSTNMFSYTGGISATQGSLNTLDANFFKLVGATNVGGLAYGISPSSQASIVGLGKGLQAVGLKMGYQNLTVPFGGVDVTSYILAMKQAGVDGAACSCVQSTNLAMFVGLKQAGMTNVKALSFASADNSVFSNATTAQAAQGAYYNTLIPPPDVNSPATTTFMNNVAAVDSTYKIGTIPSYGLTGAYLGAEVGIYGLNLAGQNPTRQEFISKMNQVSTFNAGGLLASPVGWANRGTPPPQSCAYIVQVSGTNFVTINNKQPICGKPLS
jgi:branched-chain amino acid transport system substrate-binding protein